MAILRRVYVEPYLSVFDLYNALSVQYIIISHFVVNCPIYIPYNFVVSTINQDLLYLIGLSLLFLCVTGSRSVWRHYTHMQTITLYFINYKFNTSLDSQFIHSLDLSTFFYM